MKKLIIILFLLIITITGTATAESIRTFEVNGINELKIYFPGSRIRIETWHNDYIKIDTSYLVKNNYMIEQENEMLYFNKERHLAKYPDDLDQSKWTVILNEVFFMITVPKNIPLSIKAESVNIKEGCQLKSIDAKYARVRGAVFRDGFEGKGEKIMIRENTYRENITLNYNKVIKENYRGIFWRLKNILFK